MTMMARRWTALLLCLNLLVLGWLTGVLPLPGGTDQEPGRLQRQWHAERLQTERGAP